MKYLTMFACGLLALSFPPIASAADGEYDADAYAICSACHLAEGVGVPGAFPPIRNRAADIAVLDGGREYLVTVVSYGLMGAILVAALNYVVFELNDGDSEGIAPFSEDEVEEIQPRVDVKSPAGGEMLRRELSEKHGDQWP